MEFKQLESFNAVVKYKSFTKAAEKLFISQPTISTHIRMLEEELQSRLIIRTTKSIEVTSRGWELYECSANILQMRDSLLKRWTTEDKKLIHLGASTIPSAYILPEILPKFGELFPDVYFIVNQSDSQEIIDELQHEKFDIGLIGMPCDNETLTCVPFYQDHMIIITPVNEYFLSLKHSSGDCVETLLQSPVILRERGSGSKKTVDTFFDSIGLKEDDLHVVARINDQESIKNLVAGGLGISFISEKAAQNFIDSKRLLRFDLPEQVAGRYLYIIYHKNYILKPYIQEFVNFIRKYYKIT